jgi:hypothetical protein
MPGTRALPCEESPACKCLGRLGGETGLRRAGTGSEALPSLAVVSQGFTATDGQTTATGLMLALHRIR